MVARTLLLTATSHSDHMRLPLTKGHPAIHMLLLIDATFEFYALTYQLNAIKLMTVNLYSYGSDLWGNKNDARHGRNQQFRVRTAEWECSSADTSR